MRQAKEAMHHGRLEEAQRLLRQPESVGHKGTSALLVALAQRFLERGEEHLRQNDVAAAWKDLIEAEKTGAAGSTAAPLRHALTQRGLEQARKLLDAGEPSRAAAIIGQFQVGPAPEAEVQLLEEVARGWAQARDLAGRGEVGLAIEQVERVRQLLPTAPAGLERFHKDLDLRRPMLTALVVQLHEAWGAERWRDVVRLAEQILAVAPRHEGARRARARAWKALEPAAVASARTTDSKTCGQRFLLWVDGAGGFLVCLEARITIGQATPEATVDVPLLADISRTHATLTRDAEGYLLEAVRSLQVNRRPVEKALLQPCDVVTLGPGCKFVFRQPVPVSASARLELTGGHRLPLALDGVLLMADTLVLGPGPQAHVVVQDCQENVVLYRQRDGLGVRIGGEFTVNGAPCRDRAALGPSSQVRGDDFAFAIEPVGETLGGKN